MLQKYPWSRDLVLSLVLAVLASAACSRVFFAVDGAPLVALWLIAVPGFLNGLLVRGDRTVRCLPHFIAAALLFGLLLPLLALGPPKTFDPATRTWHVSLTQLVRNPDAYAMWLSLAFVHLCAALLGMAVRGLSVWTKIRTPLLAAAVAVASLGLAAGASLDGLWMMRLRHDVAEAGYCREDADCTDIGAYHAAGLGCYVGVNEREAERMRRKLAPYATDNSPYCRNPPSHRITCRDNRCGTWSDAD